MSLLKESYFLEYSLESYPDFSKVLTMMQDYRIIEVKEEDKVIISSSGNGPRMIAFYLSLVRP
jgi:hypothetical protein